MSEANDLIERLEKETGQRLDVDDPNNMVVVGLLGAMSRMLGQSPPSYTEKDDVAAGVLLRHQMSPEHAEEQRQKEALLALIQMGFSPDDIANMR